MFGGIGAVIGGVTAKRYTKSKCHKLSVVFYFNTSNYGRLRVPVTFLNEDSGVSTDSALFRNAYENAIGISQFISDGRVEIHQ